MLNTVFERICEIHGNTQDFCFTQQILSINDAYLNILKQNDLIKITQDKSNFTKCEKCDCIAIVKDDLVICQECYTVTGINDDKELWQYELNVDKIATLLSSGSSILYRNLGNQNYLVGKPPALKTPVKIYLHSG